jgi:hypothetical protein
VKLDDVRAYAQRAWHVLTELEHAHWARELSEHGPLSTLEASQALWTHMRRVRPDWPTEADRACLRRRSPSLIFLPLSLGR